MLGAKPLDQRALVVRSKVLRRRWWPWLQPPQMMSVTVRATMHPIAGIAGDREVYRQKFLNRAGDNSVSRTAAQRGPPVRFTGWPH